MQSRQEQMIVQVRLRSRPPMPLIEHPMPEVDLGCTFRVLLGFLKTRISSCAEESWALWSGLRARLFIFDG
jgi:hypothetical protein